MVNNRRRGVVKIFVGKQSPKRQTEDLRESVIKKQQSDPGSRRTMSWGTRMSRRPPFALTEGRGLLVTPSSPPSTVRGTRVQGTRYGRTACPSLSEREIGDEPSISSEPSVTVGLRVPSVQRRSG